MDLKHKIRTYNFWISLSAAILIVLRLVGQNLGFYVDSVVFMDIATAVCGVLVVLGIIIMPAASVKEKENKAEDKQPTLFDLCEAAECNNEDAEPKTEETEQDKQNENPEEVVETQADIQQETQEAMKLAIEEISKNPEELLALVSKILKNNK